MVTPEVVDQRARRRIPEAGDAPHLVVAGEVRGERERDLAGGAGDEDLLAREHRRRLGYGATDMRSVNPDGAWRPTLVCSNRP